MEVAAAAALRGCVLSAVIISWLVRIKVTST